MKISVIVLGFMALITGVFAAYASLVTENYRQLRNDEVSGIVAFESERVGKTIAEMERNAIDLALSGHHLYNTQEKAGSFGAAVSIENFSAFKEAVGGGIWFEPYALNSAAQRACYYAYYDHDENKVRYAPEFMSASYDYHNQMWYLQIAEGLTGKYDTVWTRPYFEDIGTNSLMTTVGAGIYDNDGSFIGMSTVDWQIQSMVDRLSEIRPTPNSFVLLASPRDDYIISNTHETGTDYVGTALSGLEWFGALHFSEDESVDIGSFTDGGVEYIAFSRLFDNGWLFSVQIPKTEIYSEIESQNTSFVLLIAVAAVMLLSGTFYLISRLINRPLQILTTGVSELGDGNLDKKIELYSKDEIGMLALSFNKMTVDLKASIEERTSALAEKERIGAELGIATKIQASMLPCIFPPFPERKEFDIFASMQPAKEVGGDFYDFFFVDENTLAVVVADVSGKGVPAALFMVIAKTLIKNNAQYGKSPMEVFETVNNMLCENNEANMFVTAFMGYLHIPDGRFTYVNAGHNPPLVRTGEGFEYLKIKSGFVLAGVEGMHFPQGELTLKGGDELFLYTDGVTEAVNNENELFGEQRLQNAVNAKGDLPLKELTLAIKAEIDGFAQGAEQADDITMLALRFWGGGGNE